jgi:hypothetical protein
MVKTHDCADSTLVCKCSLTSAVGMTCLVLLSLSYSAADTPLTCIPLQPLLFLLQRISACATAGYKAVVAEFISDYGQTPGNSLGLTTSDYAAYLTWLSDEVALASMGFGAMDGPDVLNAPDVLDKLGFAVATACRTGNSCPMFAPFPAGAHLQIQIQIQITELQYDCNIRVGGGGVAVVAGIQPAHSALQRLVPAMYGQWVSQPPAVYPRPPLMQHRCCRC